MSLFINDAAKAAGVSRRTLYYWMANGRLPFVQIGVSRRVRLADVLKVRGRRPSTATTSQEAF